MTQLAVRRGHQFITMAVIAYFMSRKRKQLIILSKRFKNCNSKVFSNSSGIFQKTVLLALSSSKQEFLTQEPTACLCLPNRITQLQKWTFGLRSRCSSLAFSLSLWQVIFQILMAFGLDSFGRHVLLPKIQCVLSISRLFPVKNETISSV